jgi:hypothetical protein
MQARNSSGDSSAPDQDCSGDHHTAGLGWPELNKTGCKDKSPDDNKNYASSSHKASNFPQMTEK